MRRSVKTVECQRWCQQNSRRAVQPGWKFTITIHYYDPGFGGWKTEASKVKVGKGGVIKFSADVEKYNSIHLRDTKGEMLV